MSSIVEISTNKFASKLVGLPVSRVWRGAGTAIFLELGELSGKKNDSGEAGICIEWSWRVDDSKTVLLGSFNEDQEIDELSQLVYSSKIVSIEFFTPLIEISILLSNGYRLSSFATVSGDPQWSIRVGSKHMYVKSGLIVYEGAA